METKENDRQKSIQTEKYTDRQRDKKGRWINQ